MFPLRWPIIFPIKWQFTIKQAQYKICDYTLYADTSTNGLIRYADLHSQIKAVGPIAERDSTDGALSAEDRLNVTTMPKNNESIPQATKTTR